MTDHQQPSTDQPEDRARARALIYLRVSTTSQAERGGESEGYSIPVQRDACRRKAKSLGAEIAEEYVDAGESARSVDRPALQRMLEIVKTEPFDYVIVHKVDRLARNRLDDLTISLALEEAGVQLISCSENIDGSPSGKLTHGLMALIAEWYSSNLSAEVRTKTLEKVRRGGTIGKAPIGYVNVGRVVNGREIRTVDVDPSRADHIEWAFHAYATGEWNLRTITEELAARGLTRAATAKMPERPLAKSTVHRTLTNPYYVGKIIWGDVEADGVHEPLVDHETFDKVQELLTTSAAGEKQRQHRHYLKSSVWCGSCKSRLCITQVTNRHGKTYRYFFCVGRHQRRTNCTQVSIPIVTVEQYVADKWHSVQLDPDYINLITNLIGEELDAKKSDLKQIESTSARRLQRLDQKRRKLLEAHYADAIPLDLFKSEQGQIAAETAACKQRLKAAKIQFDEVQSTLQRCLAMLDDPHDAYQAATPTVRRQMNQAIFEKLFIEDIGVTDALLTEPYNILLQPDLVFDREAEASKRGQSNAVAFNESPSPRHQHEAWNHGVPTWLIDHRWWTESYHRKTSNQECPRSDGVGVDKPSFFALGLKEYYLAEGRGFEPLEAMNLNGFQDHRLRPLGHPSVAESTG